MIIGAGSSVSSDEGKEDKESEENKQGSIPVYEVIWNLYKKRASNVWIGLVSHIYIVDEQRLGPYKFWRHEHYFKAIKGGVEITDIVHYYLPVALLVKWFTN